MQIRKLRISATYQDTYGQLCVTCGGKKIGELFKHPNYKQYYWKYNNDSCCITEDSIDELLKLIEKYMINELTELLTNSMIVQDRSDHSSLWSIK